MRSCGRAPRFASFHTAPKERKVEYDPALRTQQNATTLDGAMVIFAYLMLDSPLTPVAVQQRIDARGREWRESQLPSRLRKLGVVAIRTRQDGDRFELQTLGLGHAFSRGVINYRLRGQILRQANGNALLQARFRPGRVFLVSMTLWTIWNIYIVWDRGWLAYLGAAAMVLLPLFVFDAMAEDERLGLLDVMREVAGVDPAAPIRVTRNPHRDARAV